MDSEVISEFKITPYKICVGIFNYIYSKSRNELTPKQNVRLCLLVLKLMCQSEYQYPQLTDLIEKSCADCQNLMKDFKQAIDGLVDVNNLFEIVKELRDIVNWPSTRPGMIEKSSVAGLYLRKIYLYFDQMTHYSCMVLFNDLMHYLGFSIQHQRPTRKCNKTPSGKHTSSPFYTPGRKTRSSQRIFTEPRFSQIQSQNMTTAAFYGSQPDQVRKIDLESTNPTQMDYFIRQQIGFLRLNELKAMAPNRLYECLMNPTALKRCDATFLRYINLLRLNEFVASKQLLMAYFDMVSNTVSRSYSSLNYAIWYNHHGYYRRAIECLQECFCSAQAADDEKCLLISLMWLARTLIQARQKNSTKYNVVALLKHIEKRSSEVGLHYVQAMSSLTLEQINGPKNESEELKKSQEIVKKISSGNRQHNHLLANANQPNPLDEDDGLPSAEVLGVRYSMNDIISSHYALISAHYSLMDCTQSSALVSQTLLHFDFVEKCGDEDVLLVNENTFLAIRNLAFHVWNNTRNLKLACELLVDLASKLSPMHRTDYHMIWRRALAEISFESHIEQNNWDEAAKMISFIRLSDVDGAELLQAEMFEKLGCKQQALDLVNKLINRIEKQEDSPVDFIEFDRSQADSIEEESFDFLSMSEKKSNSDEEDQNHRRYIFASLSMEHKAFVKSKGLLLKARLLNTMNSIFDCLTYATKNKFMHTRTCCLLLLIEHLSKVRHNSPIKDIINHVIPEVFANGTKIERRMARKYLNSIKDHGD